MRWTLIRVLALVLVAPVAPAHADGIDVANWAAPAYWVPVSAQKHTRSALAAATPLPFVAIAPCRVADTRGNGFSGSYGPPFMPGSVARSFTIAGQCGIPATAQAVSFNFTVTNTTGPGFLLVFPEGGAVPNTSTLNFVLGQTIANAAVMALGAGGGITAAPGVSGVDLLIDVNGYYAPEGVVNAVNGLFGALTLTAGTNVSITPSGNTLTIAATPGAGGPPTGPAGGGLSGTYPNPSVVSSSANTPGSIVARNGSGGFEAGAVGLNGALTFRQSGCGIPLMLINGQSFAISECSGSTFVGYAAGFFSGPLGIYNSAFGNVALQANSSGSVNSAFGGFALNKNTTGSYNTAVGAEALAHNTNMSQNTAVGTYALQTQSYQFAGTEWASQNTAVGISALAQNEPTSTSNGYQNTAVGAGALGGNTIGFQNTALGSSAGSPVTTGTNNTFLGFGTQATSAAVVNCTAVGSDATCDGDNQVRLGNASVTSIGGVVAWSALSDARAKMDIQDLPLGLDFVLGLRPVAYRLKRGNGRTDMGFLAQDVEAQLGGSYNVVGVGGDPDRTRTLRYTDLIAPLVKAIQEQQAMLEARNAHVEELERRLAALEAKTALPSR